LRQFLTKHKEENKLEHKIDCATNSIGQIDEASEMGCTCNADKKNNDSNSACLPSYMRVLVKVFYSKIMRSFYWCLLLMGIGYIVSKFLLTHPQYSPWKTFWVLPIFWAGMAYNGRHNKIYRTRI